MTRVIALGVVIVALAGPASATSLPPRPGSPTQGVAAVAPTPVASETPSMLRNALSGLRHFQLHQGRNGLEPAATARERALTGSPDRY
jgi:hypothetical protein